MTIDKYYLVFAEGGPISLGSAFLAIASGIWLLARGGFLLFGGRSGKFRSTLLPGAVHLLAICVGAAQPLPRVYEIARQPFLPLTTPLETLPAVADAIAAFLILGGMTGAGCVLLWGLSLLTRRGVQSSTDTAPVTTPGAGRH